MNHLKRKEMIYNYKWRLVSVRNFKKLLLDIRLHSTDDV